MSKSQVNTLSERLAIFYLSLRVHIDAIRITPAPYLTATKWWLLGKRLRARSQFGPLLSRSPKAYELWALLNDQNTPASPITLNEKIFALVEARDNGPALKSTLSSLAIAGIKAYVITNPSQSAITKLARKTLFQKPQWIMPMQAGDLVNANAGKIYNQWIERSGPCCSLLYADDDLLDKKRRRKEPYLKPDWNEELQRHHDFLTGSCLLRADAAMLSNAAKHQTWRTWLVTEAVRRGNVDHIPFVLHHLQSRADPGQLRPLVIAEDLPPVTVIIPTRNRADLLRTCIEGLRATQYLNVDIIIANNDSDDPKTLKYFEKLSQEGITILDQPGPFNYSTINNNAVAEAHGQLICLLNNDIEVLSPDWLAIMATQALRPEVGAVGAQLLYPDGRIQHAGVAIGIGNAAAHAHRYLLPEAQGFFRRHALPQFVTAVTAACLVVSKDKFLAVGGLDDRNFKVAFNDVDLCLRLNSRGWQSFYEPRAVLVHHESISRGQDTAPADAARFAQELIALQKIWRTNEVTDPYHHPNLSRASEQFVLDLSTYSALAR